MDVTWVSDFSCQILLSKFALWYHMEKSDMHVTSMWHPCDKQRTRLNIVFLNTSDSLKNVNIYAHFILVCRTRYCSHLSRNSNLLKVLNILHNLSSFETFDKKQVRAICIVASFRKCDVKKYMFIRRNELEVGPNPNKCSKIILDNFINW